MLMVLSEYDISELELTASKLKWVLKGSKNAKYIFKDRCLSSLIGIMKNYTLVQIKLFVESVIKNGYLLAVPVFQGTRQTFCNLKFSKAKFLSLQSNHML